LIKNLTLLFFSLKHCKLLQCFLIWFFYDFFQNYLCWFFFNIQLVNNYNYNKAKSYEESVVVFFTKYCGLLQYFSKWFFILFYWRKHCSFPHKTLLIATTFFLMGFFPFKLSLLIFFNIKLIDNLAL
jgi:hypothetical protein